MFTFICDRHKFCIGSLQNCIFQNNIFWNKFFLFNTFQKILIHLTWLSKGGQRLTHDLKMQPTENQHKQNTAAETVKKTPSILYKKTKRRSHYGVEIDYKSMCTSAHPSKGSFKCTKFLLLSTTTSNLQWHGS